MRWSRPQTLHGIVAALLVSGLASNADAQEWFGRSNAGGGEVHFGYSAQPGDPDFNPELAESMPLTIRCNGYDGGAIITVPWDLLSFEVGTEVVFQIDGSSLKYGAGLSHIGGDYTAVPNVEIVKGDPLFETLMSGSSGKILVGDEEALSFHLQGTREMMSQHLQSCL